MEQHFETLPPDGRQSWSALWTALERLSWDQDEPETGRREVITFPVSTLRTALDALGVAPMYELPRWQELRDQLTDETGDVEVKRYWGW